MPRTRNRMCTGELVLFGAGVVNGLASRICSSEPISQFLHSSYDQSFAICLWEATTRKMPQDGFSSTFVYCSKIAKGKRPKIPRWPKAQQLQQHFDMIDKAWSQDPSKRPSFRELLKEMDHLAIFLNYDDVDRECLDHTLKRGVLSSDAEAAERRRRQAGASQTYFSWPVADVVGVAAGGAGVYVPEDLPLPNEASFWLRLETVRHVCAGFNSR